MRQNCSLKTKDNNRDGTSAAGFVSAIKAQAAIYAETAEKIKNEAAVIISGKSKKTGDSAAGIEAWVNKLKAAEKSVNLIMADMTKAAGVKQGDAAISSVLAKFSRKDAEEIQAALVELTKAVSAAADSSAHNIYLLKNRLEFAGFTETAKQKLEQPEHAVYGKNGARKTDEKTINTNVDRTI